VSVVQQPAWYDDPTGRHEWRYWMPGWSDLAADGTVEVNDPLRPRWRRYLGYVLLGQLLLVPILGFLVVESGEDPEARAGVVLADSGKPPIADIVFAACPGERVRHIALTASAGKGAATEDVIWSASGDAAADQPITIGEAPAGMTTKQRLKKPLSMHQKLTLAVATNQIEHPAKLLFTMDNLPTSGAFTYNGSFDDEQAFRTAAFDNTPCGSSSGGPRKTLIRVLVAEGVLALIGVALLTLPYYAGPPPVYPKTPASG